MSIDTSKRQWQRFCGQLRDGWQALPDVVREPAAVRRWLLAARKAQIALAITVVLVPLAIIPLGDALLEQLYSSSRHQGLFGLRSRQANRVLAARKVQAHFLIWTAAIGSTVVLLLLDAPRALANTASERAAGSGTADATLLAGTAGTGGIGPQGRYLVGNELGRGAMGIVYRALDRVLHREVALKELPPQLALDVARAERFRQEARTLAQLSAPGIVQIYDLLDEDGRLFLAMELVEGGSLEELLRARGRLEGRDAARFGAEIAEALEAVHGRGIVHRDLKPANVLLTGDGRPKITDFGIARVVGEQGLTVEGAIIGSPEYMSPEQASGKPVDTRTDLYAFGILLYRLYTGVAPFTGEISSVLAQQLAHAPASPRQHVAELPDEIERLILALLAKDPERRPQQAAEVAAVLRRHAV